MNVLLWSMLCELFITPIFRKKIFSRHLVTEEGLAFYIFPGITPPDVKSKCVN